MPENAIAISIRKCLPFAFLRDSPEATPLQHALFICETRPSHTGSYILFPFRH